MTARDQTQNYTTLTDATPVYWNGLERLVQLKAPDNMILV